MSACLRLSLSQKSHEDLAAETLARLPEDSWVQEQLALNHVLGSAPLLMDPEGLGACWDFSALAGVFHGSNYLLLRLVV